MVDTEQARDGHEGGEVANATSFTSATHDTHLPTSEAINAPTAQTTYHIYPAKEKHRRILSSADLRYESPFSVSKRAAKKAKQEAKAKGLVVEPEPGDAKSDDAFFLHSPYLAFRSPPKVLYLGSNKHASPAVLIHGSSFWRKYKLQYGHEITTPGVVDPRGVVCWKHNGGDKKALKADDKKLRGYKVKTWRLWGETGKAYVHEIKSNRKAGIGPDPDVLEKSETGTTEEPAKASGVVYLNWERPFSRHTRRYHFRYSDIDFYWKGTGAVKKGKFWGIFVRFNHFKLVAVLPTTHPDKEEREEVCLARYTSSVTKKKSGRLDLYDTVILRVVEEHVYPLGETRSQLEDNYATQMERLKKTELYQIVLATALCMIAAEKEKRVAVGKWLQEAAEGAGG